MFKNTKWRDLIPILWILFYSSEINKKNTTHHRIISLLLWKQWAFSWFWRVDIWRRKCRASRTRFHAAFSEFKVCLFVKCLIIFVGHFLKNKNRYLHYMKKIYAKNFQVYMHWHWSSSEKSSFSKPIASVFSPPPIIVFSYGTEIYPPFTTTDW